MSKQYATTHHIVKPNKMVVRVMNLATNAVREETVIIDDPKVLNFAFSIVSSPLEEIENGLYKDDFNLKDVLDNVIKQAAQQV